MSCLCFVSVSIPFHMKCPALPLRLLPQSVLQTSISLLSVKCSSLKPFPFDLYNSLWLNAPKASGFFIICFVIFLPSLFSPELLSFYFTELCSFFRAPVSNRRALVKTQFVPFSHTIQEHLQEFLLPVGIWVFFLQLNNHQWENSVKKRWVKVLSSPPAGLSKYDPPNLGENSKPPPLSPPPLTCPAHSSSSPFYPLCVNLITHASNWHL